MFITDAPALHGRQFVRSGKTPEAKAQPHNYTDFPPGTRLFGNTAIDLPPTVRHIVVDFIICLHAKSEG
jgi:hypothetical protein